MDKTLTTLTQPTHLTEIWHKIDGILREQVSPELYRHWFRDVTLEKLDDAELTIRVPGSIYQLWIESNFMNVLRGASMAVLGQERAIHFIHSEHILQPMPMKLEAAAAPQTVEVVEEEPQDTMSPRNTFDSFVVGAANEFAHAACIAVANQPARTYNPLFLHGGVGLGKTHLLQAIGCHVSGKKKNAKIQYITSERFTNEFIDAIQTSSLVKFRKRYRSADVLLIDDIQFLAGKERCQEEFFHTFNALFDGHKQIVLSSDCPPSDLAGLEQRLVSRFDWGLTAELLQPDTETRLAILRKKANTMEIKIDDSILQFLADRVRTNVRTLEGALTRVASYASLCGTLTPERVETLLKDILQQEARRAITIEQIQKRVAEHFDIRLADMTSKRRPANIAFPRQIAMFLARELTRSSLTEIGEAFGGRDHGTVLHAHRLVKERVTKEDRVRQTVSLLDSQLHR